MPRARIWLQLLAAWLPLWALYTAGIFVMHPPTSAARAAVIAARAVVPAALIGRLVQRFVRRVSWPRPFRVGFLLTHVAAALCYAVAWLVAASVIESVLQRRVVIAAGPGVLPFLVLGVWLYIMVAGISYAIDATERAARAEATAARTQLAALRAQLHPHFLFNALHTVVQLIPLDPARAADAAEQVAELLRTAMEEHRDLIALRDEWAFVTRYVDMERIRFGDRLRVHAFIDDDVLDARVPSFSLQTLVENAVRHGAAPRIEPTDVTIGATGTPTAVTLRVRDTGSGMAGVPAATSGTGLARLRERLAALYGGAARLALDTHAGGGTEATIVIPRRTGDDA